MKSKIHNSMKEKTAKTEPAFAAQIAMAGNKTTNHIFILIDENMQTSVCF